jgi:hypothetical protein
MLCDKDSDDGDEVVGEFLLRVWVVVDSVATVVLVAENHEFRISLSEDPFDELHSKACDSVSVGNNNLSDAALVDVFQ